MKKPKVHQPMQKTPTGYEIPVPTREDVMRALTKVAKGIQRSLSEPDLEDDADSQEE